MPAPDYNTLYQFEPLLSATIEALFNSEELAAIGVSKASADFQKARPRVEVFVTIGSRFDNHYVIDAQGLRRENGWSGTLHLTCITAADYTIHAAYIAAVRELASRLDQIDLSGVPTPLQYHEITQIRTAGTASETRGETGEYHSALGYEIIFAIRADAWPNGLSGTNTNMIVPSQNQFPFALVEGQLIPLVDNTGNLLAVKIWDAAAGAFGTLSIVNGQYRITY